MNLAARRSSHLKEKLVMRLGCFLVTFSVLASLVLEPPKAKAFVMTSSAVTSLASGFLSACGLTPVVSGMGSSSEVNESVARLIQDFLNEEVGGISVADWALSFGEIGLAVKDKRIVIPKPFAEKLGEFARWVAEKYGAQAGVNVVYSSVNFVLADGTVIVLGSRAANAANAFITIPSDATAFSFDTFYELKNGRSFGIFIKSGTYWMKNSISPNFPSDTCKSVIPGLDHFFLSIVQSSSELIVTPAFFDVSLSKYVSFGLSWNEKVFSSVESSLAIDATETMQEVLDRLTALEEGQSIALDVGATQSMEIQDILQGILDAILAGDLAASAEIVDTAEVPVEPEEPDPPVVLVVPSGLDKLGAALTSRFPFSIPWDVYKGVTLLAAPPKAPYFEVDFLAPIAYRVGGWKGSTKIVLDFSEYEIIGQVCRWTSTVGFCLMLASGTKRLIWTA